MMDGFAIPHAKSAAIIKPSVMIVSFTEGVDWDSLDGQPIRYAIALFIPEAKQEQRICSYYQKLPAC